MSHDVRRWLVTHAGQEDQCLCWTCFGVSVMMYSVCDWAAQAAAESNGCQPWQQMLLDGYHAQLNRALATVRVAPSLHRLRLCMRASMPVSRPA